MMAHFVFDLGQIHPRIPRAKLLGSGASPAPTVPRHCFSFILPSAVASKKGEGPWAINVGFQGRRIDSGEGEELTSAQ